MLGMLASGLGTGVSAGINGLQTVFGWLASAFRFVGGHLVGFAGLLARLGALLGGVVIGGLVSFVAAIGASTKAASDHARSIIDLRNRTGLGTGAAQGIAGRFAAFGIGAGDLGASGQYHGLTSMAGRAFGVNAFDPVSINARSQSYGNGLTGFQMRQAMLGAVGMNNPQGQWLANLSPGKVAGQVAFQQDATSRMGITPETMARLAEDLPLVINKFSILKDLLINRIAATALPYLESALTRAADFLSENGETIANSIGKAIEWLANGFTWLGNFLISNGPVITQAIFSVVEWLYAKAPVLVVQGFEVLVKAGMGLAGFFANLAHGIAANLRAFEGGTGGLYDAAQGVARVFDVIYNTVRDFVAGIVGLGALIQNLAAANPVLQTMSLASGNGLIKMVNPLDATQNFLNAHPDSNLAGKLDGMRPTAGVWADNLDALGNNISGASDRYGNMALEYLQGILNKLGPEDARRAEFQMMIAELQKGNVIAEKGVRVTERTSERIGGFQSNTINRALSYIAEDAYLGLAGT